MTASRHCVEILMEFSCQEQQDEKFLRPYWAPLVQPEAAQSVQFLRASANAWQKENRGGPAPGDRALVLLFSYTLCDTILAVMMCRQMPAVWASLCVLCHDLVLATIALC